MIEEFVVDGLSVSLNLPSPLGHPISLTHTMLPLQFMPGKQVWGLPDGDATEGLPRQPPLLCSAPPVLPRHIPPPSPPHLHCGPV